MAIYLILFLQLIICVASTVSQQCQNWVSISPDDYNETYVSINSPKADEVRPIGFRVTSLQTDGPGNCFIVSGLSGNGRHIEIKYDFEVPNTLCVGDSESGKAPVCSGRTNRAICEEVPGSANTVNYTFSCTEDECEKGEITFWYRFVVEPEVDGSFDPNWCDNRNARFPSTLVAVPDVVIQPPIVFLPPVISVSSPTTPTSTSSPDPGDVGDVALPTNPPRNVPEETTGGGVKVISGVTNIIVLSTAVASILFAI